MSSEAITKNDLVAVLRELGTPNVDYVLCETPMITLDTSAQSGVDKEIYDALVELGWTDVIE